MVASEIYLLYRDEDDSEVWEYERKPVPETVYDHDSAALLLDGEETDLK